MPPDRLTQLTGRLLVLGFLLGLAAPLLCAYFPRAKSSYPAPVPINPVAGHLRFPGPAVAAATSAASTPTVAAQTSAPPLGLLTSLRWFSEKASAFRATFADWLPGHNWMLALHSRLVLKLFHTSPAPEVIAGDSGWLYYNSENSLDGYRGVKHFSNRRLGILRDHLENRRRELAARGIGYLIVIAPDKHTAYAEHMPTRYNRVGPTQLDQLAAELQGHPEIPFLDLRDSIHQAKDQGLLYYLTDSHWNELGAWIAYQTIARRLQTTYPALQMAPTGDYIRHPRLTTRGDLARVLGLGGPLRESEQHFVPVRARARPEDGLAWGFSDRVTREKGLAFTSSSDGEIPSVLIFHDSFGEALAPFLSPHFQRAIYSWQRSDDQELIDQVHPTLVIDECVERRLPLLLPRARP